MYVIITNIPQARSQEVTYSIGRMNSSHVGVVFPLPDVFLIVDCKVHNKFSSIEKAQATIKELMWDGYSLISVKVGETSQYTIISEKGSYKIGKITDIGAEVLPHCFWCEDKRIINSFTSLEDVHKVKNKLTPQNYRADDGPRHIILCERGSEDKFRIYFLSSDGQGYVHLNHNYTFLDEARIRHNRVNYFSTYEDAVTAVKELEQL